MGIAILYASARCWGVIYGYRNTFVPESYARCWGSGGCNLWVLPLARRARPAAKLGPCIPMVTPANYNLHLDASGSFFHILDRQAGWKEQTRIQQRDFGSKKPSCLLHPAAALMGSEGSQTAWAVNFTSLVLITAIHHDLGWLDVASKCIDPRLFSVGLLVLNWTIDVNHQIMQNMLPKGCWKCWLEYPRHCRHCIVCWKCRPDYLGVA